MIIPDKRKAVGLIIGRMNEDGKDGHSYEGKDEEMMGGDAALHPIAEDLLGAVKEGSAAGVVQALKAFFTQCDAQDEQEEASE